MCVGGIRPTLNSNVLRISQWCGTSRWVLRGVNCRHSGTFLFTLAHFCYWSYHVLNWYIFLKKWGFVVFSYIRSDHRRPQKFFQGGQSRHFPYPFQVSDYATQIDVHKTLYPFYTTKKMPNVTATVANIVPSETVVFNLFHAAMHFATQFNLTTLF